MDHSQSSRISQQLYLVAASSLVLDQLLVRTPMTAYLSDCQCQTSTPYLERTL
ncbi:hypothetical protein BHE74_00036027 [Ensete ventricosum]|uniref:Uncharacterized protein n=1 Tax=Ensete ventricosum TaxID=4639 RepID=A0A427A6J7_ENSVE|nr:hypothetical protein B296_00025121 [Ensete ventricosum]RWV88731.1 hypothetical protein GW17_00049159 [Ensete ventricosum]RWW57211.1 hypothetical protein BHE74_00036027 [Ensete ventricosum]RZS12362.1 hypothetical protein BHM03_00043784 [Ensete ventricosum]